MKAHLTLVFALLLVCTGAAVAQTPDGLPPALETVCDAETGSAFGWCNAYCEAMDCELANDGAPLTEPKASATACGKVLTKFEQATGRGMPCEVSCPCTDNPDVFLLWGLYLSGVIPGFTCERDGQFCEALEQPPELCAPPLGDITFVQLSSGVGAYASSLGLSVGGWFLPSPFCGDAFGGLIPLTPAQGAFCKAQLDAAVAASGLVCLGPE